METIFTKPSIWQVIFVASDLSQSEWRYQPHQDPCTDRRLRRQVPQNAQVRCCQGSHLRQQSQWAAACQMTAASVAPSGQHQHYCHLVAVTCNGKLVAGWITDGICWTETEPTLVRNDSANQRSGYHSILCRHSLNYQSTVLCWQFANPPAVERSSVEALTLWTVW